MKLDFYLQHKGSAAVFAWARETHLGVYMGVRFSPAIENASYFKDGRRQLLRFTSAPDGKRIREEIPLAVQLPIPSIEHAELILRRMVDVPAEMQSSPSMEKASAEATVITIGDDYLMNHGRLCYEAYIVGLGCVTELAAMHRKAPDNACRDSTMIRLFPMRFFPRHVLAMIFRRKA